ncbi:MAG: hypothetical protein GX324_06600 [Aeromonadales bacterium]|nr:hypothetical protein [Aeromonadales bacterium]
MPLPPDLNWPIIVHCGESYYDWAAEQEQVDHHNLVAGDQLIDSHGHLYQLHVSPTGGYEWRTASASVSLASLNDSLKEYAASLGICCVAKLTVTTIDEAIALVAWLDEQ